MMINDDAGALQIDIMGTVPLSSRMLVDFGLSDPHLQGMRGLLDRQGCARLV